MTDQRPPSVPTVGPLLALTPKHFEDTFWMRSSVMSTTVRVADSWTPILLIVLAVTYNTWQRNFNSDYQELKVFVLLCVVGVLLYQWYYVNKYPASFQCHRRQIFLFNRCVRICLAVLVTNSMHRDLTRLPVPELIPDTHVPPSQRNLPPLLDALRYMLLVSGSGISLLYATLNALPFPQQLALQLLYCVLWTYHHAAAHHILTYLAPPATWTQLCSSLNGVLSLVTVALSGTFPSSSRQDTQCQDPTQALHTLLVFVNLYFGFVLPVYVGYSIELGQKQAYIQQLQQEQEQEQEQDPDAADVAPAGRGFFAMAAYELLVMFLWGIQVWVLVVRFGPSIVAMALRFQPLKLCAGCLVEFAHAGPGAVPGP